MEQTVAKTETLMSNYTALEALVNLRQEKSLTATAQLMGMAKSTLSRRLAILEEQLGYRLTQQVKGRLLLTPAGDCYAEYAKVILTTAVEAKQALVLLNKEIQGLLKIQLCPELARGWSTDVLNSFLKQHQTVQLKINTFYSTKDVAKNNSATDLYISCKPLSLDNYKQQSLGQWQLAIYQAAKCKTNTLKIEKIDELQALNWIMLTCEKSITLINNQSQETRQLNLQPRLQVDSLAMQAEAIANGFGVGVLPKWMAECPKNGQQGSFKQLATNWEIEPIILRLYYKRDASPAVQALIKHLDKNLPPRWRLNCLLSPHCHEA